MRRVVILVLIIFCFQIFSANSISRAEEDIAIRDLRLDMSMSNGGPSIGMVENTEKENYAELEWSVNFPSDITKGYINVYVDEDGKPYKSDLPRILKEKSISDNLGKYKIKGLTSGTVYRFDSTAYYTIENDINTYTSDETLPSNEIRVLTNIYCDAYSTSATKIKIVWDDVWYNNKRINYKLYISENESFSNTAPIYIQYNSQIGEDKPVIVNEAEGTLEYTHTVRDAGRIYYVKVEPDLNDKFLFRNDSSNISKASSYIYVKTSKLSSTSSGTVWFLEWSKVVTGLNDRNIEISYDIYKESAENNELPQRIATIEDTNLPVIIPPNEQGYYYTILANVTKNNSNVFEIPIKSDRIFIQEQEVPSNPSVPELVDRFERVPGDVIIDFENSLTSDSATMIWRAPLNEDGTIDGDVKYDIWLITDPNLIDNPSPTSIVEASFSPTSANYINNGKDVIGYKYTIQNLTSNSTYYCKVVAKKLFTEYISGEIQNNEYLSNPALKIIITPTDGNIDRPLVSPTEIKKDKDGKFIIDSSSAVVKMKNAWYEKFDEVTKNWKYIRTEKLSENDEPDDIPTDGLLDNVNYRKIVYDSGVKINVACLEIETLSKIIDKDVARLESIEVEELKQIALNYYKIIDHSIDANDELEKAEWNLPDRLYKRNIDIKISDLKPNTKYIIWTRAARVSLGYLSEPSEPIFITTLPEESSVIEKPIIPEFNYSYAGDTFVDLGWVFNENYNYYIKFSTEDNVEKAITSESIKYEDLLKEPYHRVEQLESDKLYFLFIKSEFENSKGIKSESDWSDSFTIKTIALSPPDAPKGFGVKNAEDAITENSITLEWAMVHGISYTLEIAKNPEFKGATSDDVGTGIDEYTIYDLYPNTKYYVRIKGFDLEKELKSKYSGVVSVRTVKNNDDFDTDKDADKEEDLELMKEIVGEDGSKIIDITNNIADNFIEKLSFDKDLDYKIELDLSTSKNKTGKIIISERVINALNKKKEDLHINVNKTSLTIKSGVFEDVKKSKKMKNFKNTDFIITIIDIDNPKDLPEKITPYGNLKKLKIIATDGRNTIAIDKLSKPIKISIENNAPDILEYDITGSIYDEGSESWKPLTTEIEYTFDSNKYKFETTNVGDILLCEFDKEYFEDILYHKYENSINNVLSVYKNKDSKNEFFEPDKYIVLGDTLKIVFDILGYKYESGFMIEANRSGFIEPEDIFKTNRQISAEEAILIAMRLYELKGEIHLGGTEGKILYAKENDLVITDDYGNELDRNKTITRGEVMNIMEKVLMQLGEIQ